MAKLQILSAKPGVFRGRKFKPVKRNSARRNTAKGFYDKKGVFHPLGAAPRKKRKATRKRKNTRMKNAKRYTSGGREYIVYPGGISYPNLTDARSSTQGVPGAFIIGPGGKRFAVKPTRKPAAKKKKANRRRPAVKRAAQAKRKNKKRSR